MTPDRDYMDVSSSGSCASLPALSCVMNSERPCGSSTEKRLYFHLAEQYEVAVEDEASPSEPRGVDIDSTTPIVRKCFVHGRYSSYKVRL